MTFVLGLLAMLGILIFFHELGHFLVAKACGVRVEVFSLGFGPRLFGIKRGDTDYRISAFPLGGYVKMFGDNFSIEVPEEEKRYAFLEKPYWQKSSIAVAGPLANFILPVVILFFMFWGTESVLLPNVSTVVPGEAAASAGLLPGDTILSVDGQAVTTYRELREYVVDRPAQSVSLVVQRGPNKVTLQMTPRAVAVYDPTDPGRLEGRIGIMPYTRGPMIDVLETSPAATAGLLDQDRVVAVGSVKTDRIEEVLAAIDAFDPGTPMPVTVRRTVKGDEQDVTLTVAPGEPDLENAGRSAHYAVMQTELDGALTARIQRGQVALKKVQAALVRRRGIGLVEGRVGAVTEQSPAEKIGLVKGARILWVDDHVLTYGGEEEGRMLETPDAIHVIGYLKGSALSLAVFRLAPRPEWGMESIKVFGARTETALEGGVRAEQSVSATDALVRAASSTWMLVQKTFDGLKMLITGQVSLKSLGGPITIARVAESALKQGFTRFIEALCFISVNLGIVNLLPIPVLDGGHLTIFTIEAIRRKKVTIKRKEFAYKIGLALLGLVMLAAMYNDVMREVLS